MQRAAFLELLGRRRLRRHRRQDRRDRVLFGLKIATSLAAAGLIGVVVLLLVVGGADGREASEPEPTVPTIIPELPGAGSPGYQPVETTPPLLLDPPALLTESAEIAAQPPPPPPPPATTTTTPPRPTPSSTTRPPRPPAFEFAVIGEPCSDPGAISVTEDYEPVVCARPPRQERHRWVPTF